jgi:hypothetical protein
MYTIDYGKYFVLDHDSMDGTTQSALFHSPLPFLNQHLSIYWSRAEGTRIAPSSFIVIRLTCLFTVRATDNKRLIFFWF